MRQVAHAQGLARSQQVRDEAQAVVASRVEMAVEQPAPTVLVALSGGWVRSRAQPGGREVTVGVVAGGRERVWRNRGALVARRVVATTAGVEAIGAVAYREAARLGVEEAERVVVLGDGAAWIDPVARECFPRAERRVDVWPLRKRTRDAVRQATGETPEPAELGRRRGALRWRGQVAEALAVVRAELPGPAGVELAR